MKVLKFNFYSTIVTILVMIIFAATIGFLCGSCTKSTKQFIDDNDPIGPYHIQDPATNSASVFDQNIDVVVQKPCDHFFVARAIPVMDWDHDFPYWSISPKDCICIHCKKQDTCY